MNGIKNLTFLILVLIGLGSQNSFAQELMERVMTIQELSESVHKNNIQLKVVNWPS